MTMPMGRRTDFLAWAIGEGGAATGSAMPAFGAVLDDGEIRDLVTYLRRGL